jgi:hypothetical protein
MPITTLLVTSFLLALGPGATCRAQQNRPALQPVPPRICFGSQPFVESCNKWPRDRYAGPGGGLYTGPGGGLYTGPGGGSYTGPDGGMYTGPGGGMYTGPGGGLYTGPGGGLYTGPDGGMYTGPGGGLYTGPGGGLYSGSGGGLCTGACDKPYRSNQPPPKELVKYLVEQKRVDLLHTLESVDYFNLQHLDKPNWQRLP